MQLRPGHERVLVWLICAHSLAVGLILLLVPGWAVRFGGWAGVDPEFFARQAGIFHVVVVAGYLIEYHRYRGVTLLITAKMIAVVFLVLYWWFGSVPWAVPVSGLGDAVMGLMVWWVHRQLRPS